MKTILLRAVLAATFAAIPANVFAEDTGPPKGAGINNWVELKQALRECWTPPDGTEGSYISFKFSLDKNGAMRTAPMTTGTHLVGSPADQARFREAGLDALKKCFPAALTKEFGATMAENVIFLRFVDGKAVMPLAVLMQRRSQLTIFSRY